MTGLTARGVGLYLDIRVDQLNYMLNKGVLLDMGPYLGQHMNQILKVQLIIGFQDRSYLTIILTL